MKNYYTILGVPENAGPNEIKRAYRALAVKYHPDKNPSPEASTQFSEITEAYDVLSDTNKKFVYDHQWYKFVHQLVQEEPAQQHRDPRYRPRTKTKTRREKSAHHLLMEKWHRYAHWINVTGIVLVIVFVIDMNVPSITTEETVKQVWTIKGRRGVSHYNIYTESGKKIKVYNNMAVPGEKLSLSVSPLYRVAMTVVNITEPREGSVAALTRIIFPGLLLLVAAIGVFRRQNAEQSVSYGFGTLILLVASWYFIY